MGSYVEGNSDRRSYQWLTLAYVLIGIPALVVVTGWAFRAAEDRAAIEEPSAAESLVTLALNLASFATGTAVVFSPLIVLAGLAATRSIRIYSDRVVWRRWYGPWDAVARSRIQHIEYDQTEGFPIHLVFLGGRRLLPLQTRKSVDRLARRLAVPVVVMGAEFGA